MNQPLISVIIPCYNYASFLREAVQSILTQTYSNWECLIIDDGSKDNTAKVSKELEKSDSRIIYHYKTNGGLSSARNYGINLAKGNYICFLDADDLLDKEKLDIQISCFKKNSTVDIVYGKAMFFETNNAHQFYAHKSKNQESELANLSGKGDEIISVLNKKNITVVSSPLIKKEVFSLVGNFDEGYKSYEDWHFWMRCALKDCEFKYIEKPEVCTYIRFGHESMMTNKRKMINASIQLRRFFAKNLPLKYKPYNFYRLIRSKIKYLFI